MLAPQVIYPHLGLTILSLAGRLIHSWKPCSILSSVGAGISLWMMPRPAVIHWTPPGPMTPCLHVGNYDARARHWWRRLNKQGLRRFRRSVSSAALQSMSKTLSMRLGMRM